MRIAFIETAGLTNELIRAVAGAAPNCVGYPDGVPESWRDGSADVSAVKRVPEEPGKHPICETRTFPDHELDPAALLGPVVEPVDWPDEHGDDEC